MKRTIYLWLISLLFTIWSGVFIFQSSFGGIDGKRYFCLFDDAMVSMRYAWNLSHGLGLVWNAGMRVEGFTNMLMTLYMALATFLFDKIKAVFFIQLSGIGFMLAIAYANMKIAEDIFNCPHNHNLSPDHRNFLTVLAFAAALCYYPLAYWSLMGMETGLLAALLLFAVRIAIRHDGELRIIPVLPVLMGLAFLTRPDAIIPVSIILAYRISGIMRKKNWMSVLIAETAILGIFIISLTAFRYFYYGDIVPNTYTLKLVNFPWEIRFDGGFNFILLFLESIWIPVIFALLSFKLNPHRSKLLLLSLIFSAIVYQIYIGGEPWPYWRMLSPFVPLIFILCIDGISSISRTIFEGIQKKSKLIPINSGSSHNYLKGISVIGSLLFLLAAANNKFIDEMIFQSKPYQELANHMNVNMAIFISEITRPNASVAVTWAGTIPYYTGLKAIDLLGKSDKYIASLPVDISGASGWPGIMQSVPGHNKYDLRYSVIQSRPTCIQLVSWRLDYFWEFVKQNYKFCSNDGNLVLLKGSKDILWNKVNAK